jgi:hypothetical protein
MKPKFWYRGHQVYLKEDVTLLEQAGRMFYSHQRIDWMAKNGFNYVLYYPVPGRGRPLLELAAEILELRAEADRLSQSDGQAARALLDQALQSQMASLSSGWLGGAARVKWDELIADMARQAKSIR